MPVDLPSALKEALRIRPEMTDASLRLSRADVDAQAARDLVLPQVDFVASYARRGIAGGTNPDAVNPFAPGPVVVPPQYDGGFGRSFGTITENRFPDASVGVTVSLPVGNRAARAGRAIAAAAQEQARITKAQQTERVSVEVRNATITLQTAAGRIEAAIAGRIAAETQLRAEKERFAAGLSTNFFVLTRQNDLALARLTENAALTDYRKAITEFSRSAGTLLDDRKIRIEDKPAP
jgi:outer membrane protein TolC